jgi:hypothetical protein
VRLPCSKVASGSGAWLYTAQETGRQGRGKVSWNLQWSFGEIVNQQDLTWEVIGGKYLEAGLEEARYAYLIIFHRYDYRQVCER